MKRSIILLIIFCFNIQAFESAHTIKLDAATLKSLSNIQETLKGLKSTIKTEHSFNSPDLIKAAEKLSHSRISIDLNPENLKKLLEISRSLEQTAKNISMSDVQIGINQTTADFLAHLTNTVQPGELLSILERLDIKTEHAVKHEIVSSTLKQGGFILAGTGLSFLSLYILGLIAQKNIEAPRGHGFDYCGSTLCASVGLIGALALIYLSGTLAQA